MTAQPEQLLQQMTDTEQACWEGPYCAAHTHTCTHARYLNSHSSPSQHLPPALLLRAGVNGVCGKWSWRDEGKEGSDFPYQIREVGEGWEEGICGGVCGWGGAGKRGVSEEKGGEQSR